MNSLTTMFITVTFSLFVFVQPTRADDSELRTDFGIVSWHAGKKNECRYYTALSGTNMKTVVASMAAYKRKPNAFIQTDSFENQKKARAKNNFTYSGYAWFVTDGLALPTEKGGSGFSKAMFPKNVEIIADVTDAIQIQAGANTILLLNLSIDTKGESEKAPITHAWGVESVDVASVPYYDFEAYNKAHTTFPFEMPAGQTIAPSLGRLKPQQVLPELGKREIATAHGLRFGDMGTYLSLNLYRICK